VALQKSEPTLEDVFVELVGRGFAQGDDDGSSAARPAASEAHTGGDRLGPAPAPETSGDGPLPGGAEDPAAETPADGTGEPVGSRR
jgi:hypothetical protein